MPKQFTPLGNNILVRPLVTAPTRTFGVINPGAQEEKPTRGVVIRLGPKVTDSSIAIGVEVEWRKYSGTERKNGEIVLREDEVMGILEEEEEC